MRRTTIFFCLLACLAGPLAAETPREVLDKKQFANNPTVLMITGAVMLVLMLVPGFPKPILAILGAGLLYGGFFLRRLSVGPALQALLQVELPRPAGAAAAV